MAFAAGNVLTQLLGDLREIEIFQELLEGLSTDTHHGLVFDLRILGVDLVFNLQPLVFGEQLLVGEILVIALIEHHIAVEINDLLDIAQGHVQQDRHITGDTFQIPNMGHRGRQLDKAHAVAPHPTFRNLNTATFADDATVPHPLVLPAMALPILGRSEDLLAEEPVHLGLEGAVVDRFWLGHLTNHLPIGQGALAPLHDPLGRGERDLDVVEVVFGAEVAVGHGLGARGRTKGRMNGDSDQSSSKSATPRDS